MDLVARHHRLRLAAVVLVAVVGVIVSGVSNRSAAFGHPDRAGVPAVPRTDAAGTVWLCRPGLANDPCTASLDTTVVQASGATAVRHIQPAADAQFDCFYVYPTVSLQRTVNANLQVQQAEIAAAVAQASPFSQVCRVWAPMYRQQTLLSLLLGLGADPRANAIALQSLLAGWRDYLAHYNDGRPIIFLGHSQGAARLISLLSSQVDPHPELRSRMVSAIILGGNVTIPSATGARGSFQHLLACRSARQFGCVIAYSSFPSQPPAGSLFGRPGQGVSVQSGQLATTGVRVLCVNPAAVGGGTGRLDPYFPTSDLPPPGRHIATPWVEYPDLYTARCTSAGGATWLEVSDVASGSDKRPRVPQEGGPIWGFHVADVNLALGNLVQDVRQQEMAYQAAHH